VNSFFVVVPFFNEAEGIEATLDALAAQIDRDFVLVCVDNASTDSGAEVVKRFASRHPELEVRLIYEPVKGTGVACDTGFRYAIAAGATHVLRTDADCLPDRNWVANIRREFAAGAEFVAGRIVPRRDANFTTADAVILPFLIWVSNTYGRFFRSGRGFKAGWILVAGNNLAITASMYEESGGFPRADFSQQGEDRALHDRVRFVTDRIVMRDDVLVFNSVRRVRSYGYINTLLWYWDRKYRPSEIDVR
jgi:glycosyltransferase involved in cell wall biosynthesis